MTADLINDSPSMLFPRFRRMRAHRKVTITQLDGTVLPHDQILPKLEQHLALKVSAIPVTCWPVQTGIGRIDVEKLYWPPNEQMRKIRGRSKGLTGPSSDVVLSIPDEWLNALPGCVVNDASN
eukprot:521116-Amphidinium_carterae.1